MALADIEFRADSRGGVTVVVDGQPQSHVALDDPGLLVFEYVQHLALVLRTLTPSPPSPLRVTHIGGAGLTLARWIEHERPGSPQIVLEPDAALTDAVRTRLPLPRGHRIRVRAVDGRTGLAQLRDGSADVVVLDAYAAGRVPAELVTVEAFGQVGRLLAPSGVFVANLADEPGLRWVARVLASMARAGWAGDQVAIAATEVFKGRRFGNVVIAASRTEFDLAGLHRRAAGATWPTGIREADAVRRMATAAQPLRDGTSVPSPEPPAAGTWRLR